ncbi:Uncharacterized protein FWK35_00034868 [Aphis craccivora]|uniref:Uncharacterized protein n=1 Tax=Aphis craccivora TaxID=307492 RepID=A0A6G0VP93_APHCR|nr:Uncharacterized protein FWK35_00034868 [Aphis craccivora]
MYPKRMWKTDIQDPDHILENIKNKK